MVNKTQQQLITQMELTAKVMNQSTQDQLLLAKQLVATTEAVAQLSANKPRDEGGGQLGGSFKGADPAASTSCLTFGRNRERDEQVDHCASLHMEDNAAKWLQMYKLKYGLGAWSVFSAAVEQKFGAYDYRKVVTDLLSLKQEGIAEEYTKEFEAAQIQVSMFNTSYDDTSSLLILSMASRMSYGEQCSLKSLNLWRAPLCWPRYNNILLRRENSSNHDSPTHLNLQALPQPSRSPPSTPINHYGKIVNCATTIVQIISVISVVTNSVQNCLKQNKPQLNAFIVNDLDVELTEDTLNKLDIEDILASEMCQLSLNAIAGTESKDSMRIRALVQNKVMLILVDSGSSHSFISSSFLRIVGIQSISRKPAQVKVANGNLMISDQVVQKWSGGLKDTHSTLT